MNWIQKTILVSLSVILLGVTIKTHAQENLFDTLDDIKEKVGEEQVRIDEGGETIKTNVDLIDFSGNKWGSLDSEVIKLLVDGGFTSLEEIASKANYSNSKGNINDLNKYLETIEGLSTVDSNNAIILNDNGNRVANEIRFKGESQAQSIILAIVKVIRNIIGSIAILWIVIAGFQLIFARGDDTKITEQKRAITYGLIGLMIILLIERGVVVIYGVPGVERGIEPGGEAISQEVLGVISFIKALIGSAAILMIIVSGVKTITAQGEEEKITEQRKSILWIVIGLVVLIVNEFIVENLYIDPATRQIAGAEETITQNNVQNIVNLMGTIAQFILGFVGIIAFGALVYGGASMIGNYGNDEMVEKSKKVIKNAIIGIIVILSAFALVSTVIKFQ